jgi:Ran GTPase-activating protein (RanGAP) involved in mRNA processing and transport
MGCCGDNIQFSTINFTLELYDLIQNKEKITQFEIKKLSSTNIEKIFGKNLSTYIEETKICKDLGEDFKFTINNSLFYCYLNRNYAIVKNYLQVKDLVPMSYETLFKISIVLMSNYNQLYMPKINFANKTKNEIDLDGIKVDFSDVMLSNKYIFDPNISKDRIIMAKPKFEEAIFHIDENNESDNSDSESQSKKSSQENNSSVYEENSDVDSEEEEEKEEEKNAKNYLLIKDEVSPDVVKTVFEAISPYLEEDEDDFINVKKEDKGGNLRRFRRFQSSVGSSVELKQTNNFNRRVSVMNNKIVVAKKGDELKLNLFNNEEERNKKQQEQEEEQKKIINSVFIESAKITDLDVFSEMIGILAIYNLLKRISFCDFKFERETDVWDNIVYLLQENNNIRWVDLHKSNMNNDIIVSIAKVSENKRFRFLDLSENFINQDGAEILAEFLSKNKTLQKLILNNNDLENFKKGGVQSICKSLEDHPNIQLIDFSSMVVTGCGEYVAALLKKSKSIKSVILRDCTLNFKDIQNICKALSLPNISNTINNVDLSFNDLASDKSIEEIGKMLKVNKTLNRLYLEKMNLNMNNYNFILNGLNENDKIIHFNFSFNPSVKPRLFLEYFLHRKKLNSLTYIPYRANINDQGPKVDFNLDEKKIIKKFKDKRKRVKLIVN